MEELEFWVYIGKKLGISLDNFKVIKETSINNYIAIQENLNRTQSNLQSEYIKTQSEIALIENHLLELSKAISFQETLITLKSLELFFNRMEAESNSILKKTRIKFLVKICKKVKKRLSQIQNPFLAHIISYSIQQLNTYQYTLLDKLIVIF